MFWDSSAIVPCLVPETWSAGFAQASYGSAGPKVREAVPADSATFCRHERCTLTAGAGVPSTLY